MPDGTEAADMILDDLEMCRTQRDVLARDLAACEEARTEAVEEMLVKCDELVAADDEIERLRVIVDLACAVEIASAVYAKEITAENWTAWDEAVSARHTAVAAEVTRRAAAK